MIRRDAGCGASSSSSCIAVNSNALVPPKSAPLSFNAAKITQRRSASASLASPAVIKSFHAAMTACCGNDCASVLGVITSSLAFPAHDRKRNETTSGLQRELRHALYKTVRPLESLQAASSGACCSNAARSPRYAATCAAKGSASHCSASSQSIAVCTSPWACCSARKFMLVLVYPMLSSCLSSSA